MFVITNEDLHGYPPDPIAVLHHRMLAEFHHAEDTYWRERFAAWWLRWQANGHPQPLRARYRHHRRNR